MSERKSITIYTDGGCWPNPGGTGSYAVVLLCGPHRRELSGAFRQTTNNRMEMMGAIMALEALKGPSIVTLHSDSKILLGYLTPEAQARGHRMGARLRGEANGDLRLRLLAAIGGHTVKPVWVKGHAGDVENERCDLLTNEARHTAVPLIDLAYEDGSYKATNPPVGKWRKRAPEFGTTLGSLFPV